MWAGGVPRVRGVTRRQLQEKLYDVLLGVNNPLRNNIVQLGAIDRLVFRQATQAG
jgi:hypothetical protein